MCVSMAHTIHCAESCFLPLDHRDSIGDSAMSGDLRWAGSYGVNIDFVARSHCAVEIILIEDIQASQQFHGN
jgi:hypothetical protein